MFRFIKVTPGIFAALLGVAGITIPAVASAQSAPSYADQGYANTDETIHGRVSSIDDTFDIRVSDDRGFTDHVQLHQGTIINPTGLTLAPGMEVTILGYNAGSVLEANEIDTPYNYDGPAPVPVYYGAGWWYPGYAYGYGPSFSLTLVFGGGGWSYAHAPWSGHWYDNRPWSGSTVGFGGSSLNAARSYGTEPRRGGIGSATLASPAEGDRAAQPTGPRSFAPSSHAGSPGATTYGRGSSTFSGGTRAYTGGRSTYAGGSSAYTGRSAYTGGSSYRAPAGYQGGSYHGVSAGSYHGGQASGSRGGGGSASRGSSGGGSSRR
ncbi:MAG: hypothetical protein ACLPYS_00950 [Vulcanimicrobiaceae bacterium]